MAVLRYFHQDPRQTSVQESSVIDKQGTVLTQKLTTINQSITNNTQVLEDKQNSVPGKSLSTNDFTDEYKNKLRGIEEGAEVNVQSDWGEDDNTADSYIKNKPVIDDVVTQNSENLITSGAVFTAIDELPEPMIFKGSLGTGGTIQTLPAPSADNVGFVYKVITAGAYYGITAKPGDTFISDGSDWILIPSGDEPEGTVTSVGLSVPTGLQVSGSPITTSGTLAITYALGYAIPTTAKQDEWDAKQNAISDLSTIRTNASNGNTAYGWGNHANAGYQAAISDLATIRSNASEGHTAYGWGNHANAGYVKSSGVTSVAMTVPTGLAISGSPITSTGTLALSFANGYSIPTTAKQSNWDTAYGWGNHASAGYLTGITKAMVTTALGYTPPQQDTNTWRGITDSYSGTDSSISLSQKGGKALYDALVNGYASSAGNADTVDSFHVDNSGNGPTWGRLTPVKSDGVLEVGKYIDFHNTSNDGKNYATRVQVTQHSGNSVNLPTTSGTLALTSQIPTNVSQLTNDSGYITSSPLGNYLLRNTTGGIASVSGNGQNWWFRIATIKIANAYINRPIVFEISQRGYEFSILQIVFQNNSGTDPALSSFTTNNVAVYYIKKTATSTWEVYGKYSETWGLAVLHRITGCGADIGVTVNMVNIGTSDPTGITQCTYSGNVNYANSAGSVAWTNVSGRPTNLNQFTNGPGYITGITKSMVTNALGYTPPTSDTNNAVTQINTTTNASYRVLMSATVDDTTRTERARKSTNLQFNPSTGKLSVAQSIRNTDVHDRSGGWNTYEQYRGISVYDSTGSSSTGAPYNYYSTGLHVAGQYWFQLAFERGDDRLLYRGGNSDGVTRSWSRIHTYGDNEYACNGKMWIQCGTYDSHVIIGAPNKSDETAGPWVGIGKVNPSYKLHVNGACGATSHPTTSDIRIKDIQSNVSINLEDIANAPLFLFKWKEGGDNLTHVGTSAQYWKEKVPELVSEANDERKTLSLEYEVLGTAGSIAIAKEVVSLKEEIKLLQAQIAELKQLLNN